MGGGGMGGMGGGRRGMGGGQSGGQSAGSGGQRPNRDEMRKQFEQFVLPPDRLDIQQSPRDIRMVYDVNGQTRTITPGEKSSITFLDNRGNAEVESGWKGGKFDVHTKVGERLTVDEEFAPSRDGKVLATTVKISGSRIKSTIIKSVYRPAADAPAAASTAPR
jgi:hypothetical protein